MQTDVAFDTDAPLPAKLRWRIEHWAIALPKSQFSQYGPFNKYFNLKFPGALVKPQGLLRAAAHPIARDDHPGDSSILDDLGDVSGHQGDGWESSSSGSSDAGSIYCYGTGSDSEESAAGDPDIVRKPRFEALESKPASQAGTDIGDEEEEQFLRPGDLSIDSNGMFCREF